VLWGWSVKMISTLALQVAGGAGSPSAWATLSIRALTVAAWSSGSPLIWMQSGLCQRLIWSI